MPSIRRKLRIYPIDTLPSLVGAIFVFLSVIITIHYENNISAISASIQTPWGIVTSNFIFDGLNNVGTYIFYLLLLYLSNIQYQLEVRKKRYLSTVCSMFVSAIAANGIWLYMSYLSNSGITSGGESAVIFGFVGACFSLFLTDSLINLS